MMTDVNFDLNALNRLFTRAKEEGVEYIGILVDMGNEKPEVIINHRSNFETKQKYYNLAYDVALSHRHDSSIQIANAETGNSFREIEEKLFPVY